MMKDPKFTSYDLSVPRNFKDEDIEEILKLVHDAFDVRTIQKVEIFESIYGDCPVRVNVELKKEDKFSLSSWFRKWLRGN